MACRPASSSRSSTTAAEKRPAGRSVSRNPGQSMRRAGLASDVVRRAVVRLDAKSACWTRRSSRCDVACRVRQPRRAIARPHCASGALCATGGASGAKKGCQCFATSCVTKIASSAACHDSAARPTLPSASCTHPRDESDSTSIAVSRRARHMAAHSFQRAVALAIAASAAAGPSRRPIGSLKPPPRVCSACIARRQPSMACAHAERSRSSSATRRCTCASGSPSHHLDAAIFCCACSRKGITAAA